MPSNSATHMAQAPPIRNGAAEQEREAFHEFFESWLIEQNQHLQELVSASKEGDQTLLRRKIARVIEHYEQYYRAKSRCAKNDVLSMFNPTWRSSLEDAFLWIGGWRPTMAFHLLFSKSGIQFEARLNEIIQGVTTGDLGDLSQTQLNQVDELQRQTIAEEKEISEKLAKQQETVADSSMVELSHAVTESMGEGGETQTTDHAERIDAERLIEVNLANKEEGLAEVLHKADDLRLKTLKQVVNILRPMQGVHFLIAAAELHLRLHEWGKLRDAPTPHQH